jgi:predicted RNA-binding protein with PIN domain
MAEHYFIDGYNVLHRSTSLRQSAREDFESGRERLIDRVAQYCASTGIRATIVFDGQGPREERDSNVRGVLGLDVVYAAASKSADAIIERTVYQLPNRRSAVVVSGDRGITDLCIGLGALAMTPDAFLATIADETSRVRAKVERDRPDSQMARMEDSLDDAARARLEDLRRRLENER